MTHGSLATLGLASAPGGRPLAATLVSRVVMRLLFNARGERLRPAPLEVKEGDVTSVAFGPEGRIAAGYGVGVGGGVVLFDADPASWRRKAGQVANRNFTWDEWTRYFPETPYRRTIRSLPWPYDLPEAERKQAEAWEKSIPRGERPHDTTRSETKNRPGTFLGSFRRGWSFPRLPQSAQVFQVLR